ncbi:MAG: nitrogen-fixing NifU domain protein [Acidimicrobiaceae bacterium]|jgi:Fe-S cluster biogenesis protein NfuA|nr:nitrogen-fixing NifU domain protein [Acidimicrobiaceae bacterium]
MSVSRLLGKGRPAQPKSRYAIVADGGSDPEAKPAVVPESAATAGVTAGSVPAPEAVVTSVSDVASQPVVSSDTGAPLDAAGDAPIDGEHGLEELDAEELERRRVALDELVAMMRPAVQMDGGDLEVVDVDYNAGVVEVQLQGACGSCAISATTLQGGVERLLKERLEWVTEVHGGVDDSVDPLESAAMGRGAYVPRYY